MKNPRRVFGTARNRRGFLVPKSWCARARGIFYAFLLNLCRDARRLPGHFVLLAGVIQKNFEKFLVTIKYVLTSNYVGEQGILEGGVRRV